MNEKPNCSKCKYYYITWDPKCPRGCKYFGFKSVQQPSIIVFKSSGEECKAFVHHNKRGLQNKGK